MCKPPRIDIWRLTLSSTQMWIESGGSGNNKTQVAETLISVVRSKEELTLRLTMFSRWTVLHQTGKSVISWYLTTIISASGTRDDQLCDGCGKVIEADRGGRMLTTDGWRGVCCLCSLIYSYLTNVWWHYCYCCILSHYSSVLYHYQDLG